MPTALLFGSQEKPPLTMQHLGLQSVMELAIGLLVLAGIVRGGCSEQGGRVVFRPHGAFISAPCNTSSGRKHSTFQYDLKGKTKCRKHALLTNTHRCKSTMEDSSPRLSLSRQAPSNTAVLSEDPLVYLIPNLLSAEECQSYMDRVEALSSSETRVMTRSNPPELSLNMKKLWPLPFLSLGAGIPPLIRLLEGEPSSWTMNNVIASVLPPILIALMGSSLLAFSVVPLVRRFSDASSRTSDAMALNMDEDVSFVRDLVNRVSDATLHPWHAWEAPVVTRYESGAIFARHGDASPTKGSEWTDLGGQRVVTAICYLNSVAQGGETYFDRLGLSVKPTQGSALVFFPANSDTLEADDRTTHESLPPMQEKWIVQMFGRVGPRVLPPLGLPDTFGGIQ